MTPPEQFEKSPLDNPPQPWTPWPNDASLSESAKPRFGLRRARQLYWTSGLIVVGVLVALAVHTISTTKSSGAPTPARALTVAVATVHREDVFNEVSIAAEFRPFAEVELHAKVSGYVTNITVDIGDKVKAGQLLAELEVPELRDELDRTAAAQQRAEADHKDAHLAYTRLLAVEKAHPNLVAQQELDNAEAKDLSTEAAIASAKADVEKYQIMLAYTRITAPFDGVITHRYADPGALIQSGTASQTQSLPLVRISNNYRLRLDFPVSVGYVKDIKFGDTLDVKVDSLGGRTFTGTISRFTQKVDEDTRTMITEIEVPNSKLELVPGMYATVILKVDRRPKVLTIPTETISADKKSTVYVVNANHQIEERPITLGLETPDSYEVTSGLQEGDLVIVGNRSGFRPGQKVEPQLIASLAQ
jgi:RND family efflux transporter MFP subunit